MNERDTRMCHDKAMQVIEDFKSDLGIIDPNLFKVAYSPIIPARLFMVGDNPGGNPNDPSTVDNYKEDYVDGEHDFLDEGYSLAVKTRQLFATAFGSRGDELLRRIPTTNVSFLRSRSALRGRALKMNRQRCWPYLVRLIQIFRPKIILCNGMSVFKYLHSHITSVEEIDRAAPPPARGQHVYYRKVRGRLAILKNQRIDLIGFHHLSGYRWSNEKFANLTTLIRRDLG